MKTSEHFTDGLVAYPRSKAKLALSILVTIQLSKPEIDQACIL